MAGIDSSIPLGAKAPDQMQNLSSLLGVAKGVQGLQIGNQTLQQNQQATQQGQIDLQERQGLQQVLTDPSNYTAPDGSFDPVKAQANIMKVAPTTGTKYLSALAVAHKQGTDAQAALNSLTTEDRKQVSQALYSAQNAPPDVVEQTLDALGKQYKGMAPIIEDAKGRYRQALAQGPEAGKQFLAQAAARALPPETQQTMESPDGATVDAGNTSYQVNRKANVPGLPIGAVIPGTSVQKGVPPTQPTVGADNQPGIIGPHGTPPPAGRVPVSGVQPDNDRAVIFQQELAKAQDRLANPQKYMSPVDLQQDPNGAQFRARAQQDINGIQNEMRRIGVQATAPQRSGFVPTGPVPGANESKAGTVQVINDHWNNLNKQAENSQLLEGVLGNIKSLAPDAITGTESGRKAYLNGLMNALHLGSQATGDMQKDTDLLEKNIAQLGLNTPATTDAMRTIVGAARPHSTMSKGAIEEASAQIMGQIQANRAVRNALTAPKQIADQTGNTSTYQQVKQHIEEVADPRAWQFQALSQEGRKAMLSKLTPEDRAGLRTKIEALHNMGLLQ